MRLPGKLSSCTKPKSDGDNLKKRTFPAFQNFMQIIIGVYKKKQKQNVPATKWGHPQPPLSSTHACQHFSNMHEVLRLLHGWKSVESLALVTQNDVPDLKIPATKKDPLVLKKKFPPIFWDLCPFVPFFKTRYFAILLQLSRNTFIFCNFWRFHCFGTY